MGIATDESLLVQVVDAPLVMSWVELSVKVPTAWNWTVAMADGTTVTMALGQAVSIGVGAPLAPEVGTAVGGGGVPGQIEIACRAGPGGEAAAQAVIGTPPGKVGQGAAVLPPPPPQLQENATAIRTNAAPIRIQRARSIIRNQL